MRPNYQLPLVMTSVLLWGGAALGQANVTIQPQRVEDARLNYGRCLMQQVRNGTSLDFGDAAVDHAMANCDIQFRAIRVSIAADTSVPADERMKRLQIIDGSAANVPARREDARVSAFYWFMKSNAGGQPADSTAGSK